MNHRLIELAERRAMLVARAANERAFVAETLASWRGPLAMADHGLVVIRYIRSYGVLVAGVATVVGTLRAWRTAKWLGRGLLVWKVGMMVKQFLPRL